MAAIIVLTFAFDLRMLDPESRVAFVFLSIGFGDNCSYSKPCLVPIWPASGTVSSKMLQLLDLERQHVHQPVENQDFITAVWVSHMPT